MSPTPCPRLPRLLLLLASTLVTGACQGGLGDSTTARGPTETLLLSTAAGRSVVKLDATPWSGRRVWVDESRLECIDKNYVVSALRARLARGGSVLVAARDAAEVVIEPRSGALGTWDGNYFFGIPAIPLGYSAVYTLTPPLGIDVDVQQGWSLLQLFAYERESGKFIAEATLWGGASEDLIRSVYPSLTEQVKEEVERLEGEKPAEGEQQQGD